MTIHDPVVETTAGKLRGTVIEGAAAFLSVPYGAPTDGANRFLPPRPAQPWAGVREATAFRTQAPQSRVGFATRPELAEIWGPLDPSPESEDCLALNVWTPSPGPSKRPVMVWFHGGAFAFGSSNQIRLRGSRLCRRDVVVVTVNQRLNIFGHLDLSEIGGPDLACSGNAGTLDMLAALEWVRDNVAAFGGDPGNVTIFGESGGGAKVSTLLAMPRARGLFHKAIIQSGAAVRLRERDRATRLAEAVLATLRIERSELHRLRELPTRQLLAAIEPAQRAVGASPWPLFDRYPFGPTVDGPGEASLVPRHPFHPCAPALSAEIPLIIGDTADEATSFLAHDDAVWHRTLSEAEMVARIRPLAGPHTERVAETYRRLLPGTSPAERLTATLTDANFRLRSLVAVERKARGGGVPVWMYSFAWRTPVFEGRLGAPHALDVPFTFDTIDLTNATDRSPQAHRLAETMSGAWTRFAHTGRPAHEGMPDWPAYDLHRRATMVLDAPCRVADDPGAETRLLWEEIARLR